jgi:hypothetical protein
MVEIQDFGREGFGAVREDAAATAALTPESAASDQKYCVYNETRERFVAADIAAAHASPGGAEARMRALEQGAGKGLWILPYQEISPASICLPVDLVFLDNECVVLNLVESFPLASVPASSAKALSVLAFRADALTKGEIRAGDQLIISKSEEMKQHLLKIKGAKAEARRPLGPVLEQIAIPAAEKEAGHAMEEPVEGLVVAGPAAPVEVAPVEIAPVGTAPVKVGFAGGKVAGTKALAASPPVEPDSWKKRLGLGTRNWFTNLLLGSPVDPRVATRELLPGLIAYFFTGGNPVAQEVRDISATGIYIVTNERWYPGTVVRVTLTDRDHPTADRTLTVNAQAVRWGKDGVGLELVLENGDQPGTALTQSMEHTFGVNPARVEAFLENLKTPPPRE